MIRHINSHKKGQMMSYLSRWGTISAIILMFAYFSINMWGLFFTVDNMVAILRSLSIAAITAIGMTFAVSVNGMDLSLGATAGFAMNMVAIMFIWHEMNTFWAIIFTVILTSMIGLVNAFLIVKMKIPDMLATLATQFMVSGLAITISGGGSVTEGIMRLNGQMTYGKITPLFKSFGRAPWIIIIMAAVVLVAFVFFAYTKHGRYMYITGENIEAARLSGINVNKYRTLAYVASAFCASIAGILLCARLGSAQMNAGDGYLMPSVAAVFIGLSIAGSGKANPLGTFMGAFLMTMMENGLIMKSVPYYSMNVFKGVVLALALVLAFVGDKDRR